MTTDLEPIYERKKVSTHRTQFNTVEMILRILAILGSILLVASGGVYLGIGVVNKIFGVVGYTFALAIFGTAVELLIIIWRIIAYIFNKDARDSFLPSIVVSLLLVVAHIAATVTTAVTVVVAFAQEKSPTHSPEQIFGVKHPAIATLLSITAVSFLGLVLYSLLGAWEIFMYVRWRKSNQ